MNRWSHDVYTIIVQGDHGPRLGLTDEVETSDVEDRFGILNAFYLPGDAELKLYPSISSVNTFRLILSEYFDANYPLLEQPFVSVAIGSQPRRCHRSRLAGRVVARRPGQILFELIELSLQLRMGQETGPLVRAGTGALHMTVWCATSRLGLSVDATCSTRV